MTPTALWPWLSLASFFCCLWCLYRNAVHLFAHWRAHHAKRRLTTFLQITPTYDGLLRNFQCHSMSPQGEMRGHIVAEAPLLDSDTLEETAVALLLDSLTGFCLWSAGHVGFVTAELSFKATPKLRSVKRGEELLVKAWVKQSPRLPEDKRLREFAILGFELRNGDQVVAEGEQLMVSIAGSAMRFFWKLQLLCPPLFEWKWRNGMEQLKAYNKYSQPFEEIRSIEELLSLVTQETPEATLKTRLLNVNGVGHGAATAALLCLAAARGGSRPRARLAEAKFFYLSPAPALAKVTLSVKPGKDNQVQVFMRAGGPVIARANITLRPSFSPMKFGLPPSLRTLSAPCDTDSESESGSESSDAVPDAAHSPDLATVDAPDSAADSPDGLDVAKDNDDVADSNASDDEKIADDCSDS
ncbi:unnamed protein product [Effrenium voratum]|nr:unnamed protein product [Effrenium voratum]